MTATSPSPSPSPSADASTGSGDDLQTWFTNLGENAMQFGIILLVTLGLYVVGRLLISAVGRSIEKGLPLSKQARAAFAQAKLIDPELAGKDPHLEAERRRQRSVTMRAVLNSALVVLVATIIVTALLSWLGIPLAPLIASAGIIGVALGFGAQSLVKDVLSGMFMLMEDQYGVGDVVDLGEASGTVEQFGLRATRVRSVDGTVWYVPNGTILRVGNMTRLWSRALIEVRLAYNTDIDEARVAFLEAIAQARMANPDIDKAILSDPEIPGVESLDYDAVVMRMLLKVAPGMQWDVMRAVRIQLRHTLKAHGIEIAVPVRTMYLDGQQRGAHGAFPAAAHPAEDDEPL